MPDASRLRALLHALEGRSYPAYKDLKGSWRIGGLRVEVRWVQGDPFAAPSVVWLHLGPSDVGLDPVLLESASRRVGVEALFARTFARAEARVGGGAGSGRSGELVLQDPGQIVTAQTAVRLDPTGALTARLRIGLPAQGRRILGRAAADLLLERLPERVDRSLRAAAHDPAALRRAAEVNEDADALRRGLGPAGLVAFVADGSVLPRRSGVDDRPLGGPEAVPFQSPPSLRVTLDAPHAGPVSGMGIRRGVTLVAGGGFHGKSTLLRALERGVTNHAPDDGRERVVTDPDAVKIRAEDGRAVSGVDISPFIGDLPGGRATEAFSTPNASGSTSQAAALVEALESGATVLLMDEDTTATNFMIRDRRMQALVPDDDEPIRPFVDRVRSLHDDLGVSTVLVVGGSGDYLDVADTVVVMRGYTPVDATERAHAVRQANPTGRRPSPPAARLGRPHRTPDASSFDPARGHRDVAVRVRAGRLAYGRETLDLRGVEQLVHPGQIRAVGAALAHLHALSRADPARDLRGLLEDLATDLTRRGLELLDPDEAGEVSAVRMHEVAAALNRLRSLRVRAP